VGDQVRTTPAFQVTLGVWRRRKRLGLMVFAATLTGAVGVAAFLPDLYRSTATLLVERLALTGSAPAEDLETPLRTLSQEILSRGRLSMLITQLDLYPEWRKRVPPEILIERMRRDIRIEFKAGEPAGGQSGTVAFTLSYQGTDPVKVARVANTLGAFYVQGRPWLRARLARLEEELSERRARFTDRHPDVVQVKAEIAALKRQLAAAHDGEPAWIPAKPISAGHAARGERAEQPVGQFRVLDPAIPAQRPMLPNRTRLVVLGLILATGAAVLAAVVAERLDTTFHTTEELRAFSKVPVLANIPRIMTSEGTRRRLRELSLAGTVGLGLALLIWASYVIAHDNQDLVLLLKLGQR
jgi:uncharacterized protein involved in exopolysaccharide biosynthesis